MYSNRLGKGRQDNNKLLLWSMLFEVDLSSRTKETSMRFPSFLVDSLQLWISDGGQFTSRPRHKWGFWDKSTQATFSSPTALARQREEPLPSWRQCEHKTSNKGSGTAIHAIRSFGDRYILVDVCIIWLCVWQVQVLRWVRSEQWILDRRVYWNSMLTSDSDRVVFSLK